MIELSQVTQTILIVGLTIFNITVGIALIFALYQIIRYVLGRD